MRIARGLQSKGIFLLNCEISPSFVIANILFLQNPITPQTIDVINVDNTEDRIKLQLPNLIKSPIFEIKLKRL